MGLKSTPLGEPDNALGRKASDGLPIIGPTNEWEDHKKQNNEKKN
jgi:hypothetical protein